MTKRRFGVAVSVGIVVLLLATPERAEAGGFGEGLGIVLVGGVLLELLIPDIYIVPDKGVALDLAWPVTVTVAELELTPGFSLFPQASLELHYRTDNELFRIFYLTRLMAIGTEAFGSHSGFGGFAEFGGVSDMGYMFGVGPVWSSDGFISVMACYRQVRTDITEHAFGLNLEIALPVHK